MTREIFQSLLLNAALLLALVQVISASRLSEAIRWRPGRKLLAGLVIGLIGVGVMSFALPWQPGIMFDVRTVMLSIAGLFFGLVPTVVAMVITAAFRLYEGGAGVPAGIGTIAAAGLLGLIWRSRAHGRLEDIDWRELYALGMVTSLAMLAVLRIALPGDVAMQVTAALGWPVLLIYPFATVGLGLLLRDALQRRRAARELRASESRYRTMFENQHAVMLLIDPETQQIVDANPAAARYYGWTRAELCAMKISDLNVMSEHEAGIALRLALSEQQNFFEFQHRLADGSIRDIEASSVPVTLGDRRLIFGIIIDVTARKEAESALRNAREKLNFALSSSGIANWEINLADLRVQRSIDHDELFGYGTNQPEWTREIFLSHVLPEDREYTEAVFLRAASDGADFTHECRIRRVDGAVRWVWLAGTHLETAAGQAPRMAGVIQDITRRKEREAELEAYKLHLEDLVGQRTAALAAAREQAEAANLAKSTFLANVSHEIRTPLNAIIGLTHLLRTRETGAEEREKLYRIDEAGRHLLKIINDVLDLSKIEAGRMQLETEPVDIGELLHHVASLISQDAEEKGIRVQVQAAAGIPVLDGDATRLRQALLNYAGNAVKFTEHGEIRLRASAIEQEDDECTILFEVEDTGIGMSPDQLNRIFGAFEQVDNSVSRRFRGTGLGLRITRQLARLMGGEAGVESTEGEGSRFWFTARLRENSSTSTVMNLALASSETEAYLRHRGASTVILVADDNPINLEITVELLKAVGLAADTASDGREAIEMAEARDYALILMDVQMPEMDGVEATQLLRQTRAYAARPILALTANAFTEDRKAYREAGMTDVITKPVTPRVLYDTLAKWLRAFDEETPGVRPAAPAAPRPGRNGTSTGSVASGNEAANGGPPANLERLATIPGVELDRILGIFGDQPHKYLELLQQMLALTEEGSAKLEAALAAGDWSEAAASAHRIKGAAANMGLELLKEPAAALEAMCRRADHDAEHLDGGPELAALTAGLARIRVALDAS